MALIVCALGGAVAVREARPGFLPDRLRPKPTLVEVTKTVEVPTPVPAQYVAILQKGPLPPAFLLTFDLERRVLTVRSVGVERRQDKSYELWLISDKLPGPRSLGVIGDTEFVVRPELASYDAVTINSATYAVSLEPAGGAPGGRPTGPFAYTGRLVQTTPPGFGNQIP
jgi:anti-sigma-K factor RskA